MWVPPSALETCSDLDIPKHVERQRTVISFGEIIALERRSLDLDLVFKRVDPVAPPIDEPFEGFTLGGPSFMSRDVPALVRLFDLARQADKRAISKCTETEDSAETPSSAPMQSDLTV